MILLRILSSLT